MVLMNASAVSPFFVDVFFFQPSLVEEGAGEATGTGGGSGSEVSTK